MRNLFLKQAVLLFGMFILVSSCSTDDINLEQLEITENFDFQRFYEDYKNEIHNLSREEFAGLNPHLRILAKQDFTIEKNHAWWNAKLDNMLVLKSLTNDQKDLIRKVKSYFVLGFFDKTKNELLKKEVLKLVEDNASKVGFDNEDVYKIFMCLGDLDERLNFINSNLTNKHLASEKSIKVLGINVDDINSYNRGGLDPGPVPISDCSNYGCFFCNPGDGCDCTSSCNFVPGECGIGGKFDCHAICCP